MNRNLECVKALDAAGAELNRDSFEDGTPLQLAIHTLAAVNTWGDDDEFQLSNPVERRELLEVADYLATSIYGTEKAAELKEDWPPAGAVDDSAAQEAAAEAAAEARDAKRQERRDKQEQDLDKAKDERDTALQEAMRKNRDERAGTLKRTATVAVAAKRRWRVATNAVTFASRAEPEPEPAPEPEPGSKPALEPEMDASSGDTLVEWMNAAFEEDYEAPEDCIAAGGIDLLGFFCDLTGMTDKMDDDSFDDEDLARSLTPTTSKASTLAGSAENFGKLTLAMERYLQGKVVFRSVDLSYIDVQAMVRRGSDADLNAMLATLLCCVRKADLNVPYAHELMERVSQLDYSTLAALDVIEAAAMARATKVAEGIPPANAAARQGS